MARTRSTNPKKYAPEKSIKKKTKLRPKRKKALAKDKPEEVKCEPDLPIKNEEGCAEIIKSELPPGLEPVGGYPRIRITRKPTKIEKVTAVENIKTVATTIRCYACPTGSNIVKISSMEDHFETAHPGLPNPFKARTDYYQKFLKCKECGKLFARECNLKTHMRLHNGKLFMCSKCKKGFITKRSLERHTDRVHETVRQLHCDQCGDVFNNGNKLFAHKVIKHTPHPRCHICYKELMNDRNLKHHLNTIHFGQKLQNCEFCVASFRDSELLRKHVEERHESEIGTKEEPRIQINDPVIEEEDPQSERVRVEVVPSTGVICLMLND